MEKLLVHYNVPKEYVLLETFLGSANATRIAVDALNRELFDGKLQIELIVFAPEKGSLKQYIGLTVQAVGGIGVFMLGLAQFLDSPSIQSISEEVFGTHATEKIINEIRELKEQGRSANEGRSEDVNVIEEAAHLSERVIVQSVKASLQAPREILEDNELSQQLGYELGAAQSEMYGAALADTNVRGVGFEENDEFPVPRHEFAQRAIRPRPPNEDESEEKWSVSIVRLRVTSPNFDREDQQGRKWKGKHTGGGFYLFEIADEEFWNKLSKREFEFSEGTDIEVQIATRISGKGPRQRKVLRVLKINRSKVAEPLGDEALRAVLGDFQKSSDGAGQPDLFS